MPTKLRILLPVVIVALIGSIVWVVTSDDGTTNEAGTDPDSSEETIDDSDGGAQDDAAASDDTDEAASDDAEQGNDGQPESEEGPDPIGEETAAIPVDPDNIRPGEVQDFGTAPPVPDGPWSDETVETLDQIVTTLVAQSDPLAEIAAISETNDPRLAWAMADLLRFINGGESNQAIVGAAQNLMPGVVLDFLNPWNSTVNQLIAWDIPVPETQYLNFKRNLYSQLEPKWAELFVEGADIDWRHVSWGGVGIDDREFGSQDPCNCIPALDNPEVTPASEGDWYPDNALVFGLEINGESRAYPKNIMEVHEMVNDTLGGRNIGMPYCTLCGAAQAYLTDELPEDLEEEFGRPVFRTSGLLIRSNKMMFERNTRSFVDTFQGDVSSGPLADAGIVFEQTSVVTATWGDWKEAHPDTTIIAEDGGLGRSYELDPLGDRDDNGPIFPVGDVDPRLPVQEPILGVITDDGTPIAFHVGAAVSVLSGGEALSVGEIDLRLDAGGIRAFRNGEDAGGHQAFWFAWSQFYPETQVWPFDFE